LEDSDAVVVADEQQKEDNARIFNERRSCMAKQAKAPQAPTYESDLRLEHTAAIIERRINQGKKLPLEVLLDTMDRYEEQQNYAAAAAIADKAAPFVHPKLRDYAVSVSGGESPMRIEVSKGMAKLSQKELDQLEKLLAKASGE
jgi:hypothetical protein